MKRIARTVLVAAGLVLAGIVPARGLELPEHPRLYLRSGDSQGRAPGVDSLKARLVAPGYDTLWQRVLEGKSLPDRALVFLLTGDSTGLPAIRQALEQTGGSYGPLQERCLAYDWAWAAFTPAERRIIARRLVESAEGLNRRYQIPNASHNMCRGRNMGQGLVMLAAWEELEGARALQPLVERELRELLELLGDGYPAADMEGRAGDGGGWPEGYDYDRHGSLYALELLLAWRSCGLGDHLTGSAFWRDKLDWMLHGTGPDGSFINGYEDNDWPFVMPHDRQMMLFLEGELQSGLASWWVDTFADSVRAPAWWEFLYAAPAVASAPPDETPTDYLVPGLGLAQMRSSWEPDATWLSFHCGPWYTYHQHAAQGSLTLWRAGEPLLIEPGVYDGEVHGHYVNWRIRTISHNCLTVLDPEERFHGPEAVPEPANDGGQVVQNWTHKPSTVAEWRAQREMRATGKIVEFRADPSHSFAAGEAGPAYRPGKVPRWRRELLFVKPGWVVVYDLVVAGNPDWSKTLHFHTPTALERREGGAAAGQLSLWSLLPQGTEVGVAGGPGQTFAYGGNNWETIPAYNDQVDRAWRLELTAPRADTVRFLTVLGAGSAESARPELVAGPEGRIAVAFGGYRASFDPSGVGLYTLTGPGVSYSLSGRVLDRAGMPAAGAELTLDTPDGKLTRITDHRGRYTFAGLTPGGYSLWLAVSGQSREVELKDHSLSGLDFESAGTPPANH